MGLLCPSLVGFVADGVIFEGIYKKGTWATPGSWSGPGSTEAATWPTSAELLNLVEKYRIASVLDVGCGDGAWIPDLPGYLGLEVSPTAIKISSAAHPDRAYALGAPRPDFPFDLVLCRDVIQHLSLLEGWRLLRRIRETGSTYLLASTFTGGKNVNIRSGPLAYSPDMRAHPFSLGDPIATIWDGWDYEGNGHMRDPRKELGLWRL